MTERDIFNTSMQGRTAADTTGRRATLIFYHAATHGRGGMGAKWSVGRYYPGDPPMSQRVTDPNAAWYDHRSKTFHVWSSDQRAAQLEAAIAWVAERYGERGPWVRNGFGDQVPAWVEEAVPTKGKSSRRVK